MTPAALLCEVGEALYGPHARTWQREMADALDINLRTVQRWAIGDGEPVAGVWADIADLVLNQCVVLAAMARRLQTLSETMETAK